MVRVCPVKKQRDYRVGNERQDAHRIYRKDSMMVPFDSVQTGVEEKQMNQDGQALNADRVVTGHYF